jgi:hypothetical protein
MVGERGSAMALSRRTAVVAQPAEDFMPTRAVSSISPGSGGGRCPFRVRVRDREWRAAADHAGAIHAYVLMTVQLLVPPETRHQRLSTDGTLREAPPMTRVRGFSRHQ